MRIAAIADIHGNSIALKSVLDDLKSRAINQLIMLGDIVIKGPEPGSVFQMVQDVKPICWIKGNTDMWFREIAEGWQPKTEIEKGLFEYYLFAKQRLSEDEITFLSSLPTEQTINVHGTDILCVHGSPGSVVKGMDRRTSSYNLELMVESVPQSIILSGHTHVPFIGTIKGKSIFNVGSVGLPSDGSNLASYGVIDICPGVAPKFEIVRVTYSISETIKIAKEQNFPDIYNYEQSLINGRPG